MGNNNPLVTVAVVTYNSSRFVEATLNSIASQTYKNIELLISDDSSKDDTVAICEKWVNENGSRFVRCKIIKSPINTGVSANNNRAIDNAEGDWFKGIAGDDLLLPNCVEDYVHFVENTPEANIVFSNYYKKIEPNEDLILNNNEEDVLDFYDLDASEQFKILLYRCIPNAPTSFMSRNLLIKHKYNELYKYMEDIPMWVNLTKAGEKLHYLNKPTVVYRVHETISNSNKIFNSIRFTETCNLYSYLESLRYCREYNLPDAYDTIRKDIFLRDVSFALFGNKKTFFTKYINVIIGKFVRKFCRFKME